MGQKNNRVQFDEYKNEVYNKVKDTEVLSIMSQGNWELSNFFPNKIMASTESINANLYSSISQK